MQGESYFPYNNLHEIKMMFSQLAKRLSKVLPADLTTDHEHHVINQRSTVLRRNKNMVVKGGIVSHCCILVIRNLFIDFIYQFPDILYGLLFLMNNFPLQSLEYTVCNIELSIVDENHQSYRAQ